MIIIIIINKGFALKNSPIMHGGSGDNTYNLFSGYAMFESWATANECYAFRSQGKQQLYNVGLSNNKCNNFTFSLFLYPLLRAKPSARTAQETPINSQSIGALAAA
jgi:hypothetical protein